MPRYYTVQTNNPFDALNVDSDDDQILAMRPTPKAEEIQKDARQDVEVKERSRGGRAGPARGGGRGDRGGRARGGFGNERGGFGNERGGYGNERGGYGNERGEYAGERGYDRERSPRDRDGAQDSVAGQDYYLSHDNRGGQRGRARRGTRGYNSPANKRIFDRRGGVIKGSEREPTDPNTQLSDEVEAARGGSDNVEVSSNYAEPEEPKPKLIDMETYLRENDMFEYMPETVEAAVRGFNTDPTKGPLDIFTFCDRPPASMKRGQSNLRGGRNGGDRGGRRGGRGGSDRGRNDSRGYDRGGNDSREREEVNERRDSPGDTKNVGSHSSKSPKKLCKDTELFPALA